MPDDTLRYDADKTARLVAFLNARWKNKGCQQCGRNDWTIIGPMAVHPENSSIRSQLPIAALICRNCGSVQFVSTIVAGLDKGNL